MEARLSSRLDTILEDKVRDIRSGLHGPGYKLPSLRQFAIEQRISKSSAVEIYERLVALELIEARGQKGFFVRRLRGDSRHKSPVNEALALEAPRRGRRSLLKYHPSGGWVDAQLLPSDALRSALREASRAPLSDLMSYSDCQGYLPLRNLLSDRLLRAGIEAGPNEILIADSASMAIDLICRLLLKPGDTVLVDNPTSLDFAALRRLHLANVVGVPFRDGQRDLDKLAELVTRLRPKLYLMASVLHNPTGVNLPAAQAFDLLSILRAASVYVVEDDVYADLAEEPTTRLAALSGLKGVAYVGSFSKTISGGLRCGFISAEPDIIEALATLTLDSSFGLNSLTSIIVFKLLKSGLYRRNLSVLRNSITRMRLEMIRSLREAGFEVPIEPEGGIFVWARWTGAADASLIAETAGKRQVLLATGPSFSPSGDFGQYMRFNCTLAKGTAFWKLFREILADAERSVCKGGA
ncbi:PLP-dependent aminotransferase family protein [Breoghania sp.]|uniref:aminotransferase-like domain-containing protein n=1 Tax=Breoghania sp. TaxID=2065378 RepID=UPI002AA6FEB0|nr:PLP-dependent aminotransferase family protein [Breoghania sp.]